MDAPDLGRLQQEFLAGMSDATARLGKAWTAAVRKAGVTEGSEKSSPLLECVVNPFGIGDAGGAGLSTAAFQNMWDLALENLPQLLKQRGDSATTAGMKDRWAKSYVKMVRDSFGIPEPSETDRLVEFWRSSLESLSGSPHSTVWAGMFPRSAVPGWPFSPFFPGRPASGREMVESWAEAYAKTIGFLFPLSATDIPSEFREQTKLVVEAQTRFLRSVARFHEQMVETARKGLETVIAKVASLESKEITADVYKRFCDTWVSAHEKAFEDLFKSEKFSQVVADTVRNGVEAKTNMDALISSNLSQWNIPNRKYVDDLREEVASVKRDVLRLEEEIETLRQLVEQLRQQRG